MKCQIKYELREFKEGRQQNNLRVSSESYLRPFQYKVLNNVLFTNDILFKIGYIPTLAFPLVMITQKLEIMYCFISCPFSNSFWMNVTLNILI